MTFSKNCYLTRTMQKKHESTFLVFLLFNHNRSSGSPHLKACYQESKEINGGGFLLGLDWSYRVQTILVFFSINISSYCRVSVPLTIPT